MKRFLIICLLSLSVSGYANAQKLTSYAKRQQQELAEKQRVEKAKYDEACKQSTLAAYKAYLSLYPTGKYANDVKNRIADYDLWDKAKSTNTIEAYNKYKSTSVFKFFAAEADASIEKLKATAAWSDVQYSTSITDIQSYLRKYPDSPNVNVANKRIHELRGVEYYIKNDYISAYNEFVEAGGRYSLEYANRARYDACEEFVEYKKLTDYSSEKDLMAFLKKYPSSKYKNDVSNKIAVNRARGFSIYATDYTYNEALRYATNEYTRNTVKSYIELNKKNNSQYKKKQRRTSRRANGRLIQFGLELFDMGCNPSAYQNTNSDIDILLSYNAGVSLRMGNYRSPVQLEIGAKPGLIYYTIWHSSDEWYSSEDEPCAKFHLPVYAKLKVNLCSLGTSCKMFLSSTGYYNAIREKDLENEWAISGGLGWAWKHWDISAYYKVDLNNKSDLDNDYLGFSVACYF